MMSSEIVPNQKEPSKKAYEKVDKKLERRHDNQYIPIGVWLHKDLSVAEKALLVDINAYAIEMGYAWASNGLLGQSLGLSVSRTSELVASLQAKGLITIEYITEGKQHLERRIRVNPEFDFRAPPDWYEEDESDATRAKFTGVNIPLYIWENKALTIAQRMMLGQIALLEGKVKGCFAGNQHFAELFGLSVRQVSRTISSLSDEGYVHIELIREGKKCVERRIYTVRLPVDNSTSGHNPNTPPSSESDVTPFGKRRDPLRKASRPSSESVQDKALEKNIKKESPKDTGRAALAGLRKKGSVLVLTENQKQEPEVGQAKNLVVQGQEQEHHPETRITPKEIKALYDKILGQKLVPAGALTAKRKTQILSLMNLKSLFLTDIGSAAEPDFWKTIFTYVRDNSFMTGNNPTGWAASLDWLSIEDNLVKVIGGTYDKRSKDSAEKIKRHEAPYSPDGVDYSRTGMMKAGAIAKGVFVRELCAEEMANLVKEHMNEY